MSVPKKYEKHKQHEIELINLWQRHCEVNKIPCLTVEARNSLANVKFDHATLPKEYDETLSCGSRELAEKINEIFEIYKTPSSTFRGHTNYFVIENMPIYQAELAACDLFDLILSYLPATVD